MPMPRVLILGLGNYLLADEGFGVHAARALIESGCPEDTTVLDIGTAVLDAVPDLETADYVIVLDAVKAGKAPGSVYRVPFEQMEKPQNIASMHGFDLSRVLALTRRKGKPEVVVIGVEPGEVCWSLDLSPEVKKALPVVIHEVTREIEWCQKAALSNRL